jgi:hypothetical protein
VRDASHSACGAAGVAALALLLWMLAPARGHAHPEAALSPEFPEHDCIERVDLRETAELHLPYVVVVDDVTFTEGDIVLPDARTHQFFAFGGSVAPYLLGSQLFPFAEESEAIRVLPEWITQDDVDRSAAAAGPADATGFIASQVEDTNVLEARGDLTPFWQRITEDGARVPILVDRALVGFSWDLGAVTPGAYQIAGYVFSPPYNAWAARSGVIKVMDGTADFPALTVDAIDGMIFGGQGRRVRGCVDAPEGTRLQAHFRTEDQPDQPWQRFAEDVEVADGRFELCFLGPAALSGLIRVRVEATAPDGTQAFAHTPDTLVLVSTPANCTEGESVCCPEPAPDAGVADAAVDMDTDMEPESPPESRPDAATPDAASPVADAAQPAARTPTEPAKSADASSGGGCSASRVPAAPGAFRSWLLAAAMLLIGVLRRSTPSR